MPQQWEIPQDMTGDARLIRIGASLAGDEQYACPARDAVKARPGVRPLHWPAGGRERYEDFLLGPVMAALDRIEFNGALPEDVLRSPAREGKPLHEMQLAFVRHAVRAFHRRDRPAQAPPVGPVRLPWVVQRKQHDTTWEHWAWGRRYENPEQGVREFVFLRYGRAGQREREDAQIAIAAFAAAFGSPARIPGTRWMPYRLRPAPAPVRWVRVAEVGLRDGSYELLWQGTPQAAQQHYAEHGRAEAARLARGTEAVPGSACADCKRLSACQTVPRIPGVLGLGGFRELPPLREVSVSTLRYHRECPARAFASACKLPRAEDEYDERNRLGKAVHRVLELAHSGRQGTPPGGPAGDACGRDGVPQPDQPWGEEPNRVTGEAARIGAAMLRHHLDVCPFHSREVTQVRGERQFAVHDTAANVIVIATPDLLYLDAGSWVWREIKTTQRRMPRKEDPVLAYPQIALATVLLAEGALGGDRDGSRGELETLHPDYGDVEIIEPAHEPERVAAARRILREWAGPWRADELFPARPAPETCRSCPVSQWCPASMRTAPADGGAA
ncbi:PD-(D/E)XK nuclease family protein [Streptomyces aidingensis]|uniref:PD-(D/E)XK nuclease superfamily protein n=1 Tax=Streptomyces aidingensis TaxID=910347 RepID=A0A1I1MBD1_9ACTN|nr:PD-(D/E)XK nuclease family protein [Streptomyces aidingensis]SFC82701.1 PD-(D/E)XK nuclease superfamily protein [Streptomyces aidingensis]